jgi:pyruvate, orthophosphate dikinase
MVSQKWVYFFSKDYTEGDKTKKNTLGGKGANLAEMALLGLNVPPGFTISTPACLEFQKEKKLPENIKSEVQTNLEKLQKVTGKRFGELEAPLLVSVRSGAPVSMPGMMDTVLNLGLNDEVVTALAKQSGDERFAWDSYRRFIQMYANVVLDMNTSLLEIQLEDLKEDLGVKEDYEIDSNSLKELCQNFKRTVLEETGVKFPTDPMDQLWRAVDAVFKSWDNPRAIKYREINNISDDLGTAVNVQSMVFGNLGEDCATGVCFTRNPSNGDEGVFGEYLINAQGEDVVAGIRTPAPLNKFSLNEINQNETTLENCMESSYEELKNICELLEKHYRDMQDIEFTIERGRLFFLQTRSAKRTAKASLKVAMSLLNANVISEKEAILRVTPEQIENLLHPSLDPKYVDHEIAKGLPASPGAVSGVIALSAEEAISLKDNNIDCILVRQETSPEDISGMVAAKGILTARGGMTSHAAVVARGMGKTCVAGCSSLVIKENEKKIVLNGHEISQDEKITIEGASGRIFLGEVPTIESSFDDDFSSFMNIVDKHRVLNIRTNADTPKDTKTALKFGAEGIGLCRTEHMFFEPKRIKAVREMIFSKTTDERKAALEKVLPFQRKDFSELFITLDGKPCNIRLLDPPLHEFLPSEDSDLENLAKSMEISLSEIKSRVSALHEFNPMLGHRGCRLGISYPEIYEIQIRAIVEAGLEVSKSGVSVNSEIMIPLISTVEEFKLIKDLAVEVIDSKGSLPENIKFKIGTMIELPRAAIIANQISKEADFLSFGTNDLTQTTFGLSRDDSGKFLPAYVEMGILENDPFVSLDPQGVGFLVEHATVHGRNSNKEIHIGICGEHGGDPKSIEFCHKIGLDYVSCSPYRVPVARLAAAQVAIKNDD